MHVRIIRACVDQNTRFQVFKCVLSASDWRCCSCCCCCCCCCCCHIIIIISLIPHWHSLCGPCVYNTGKFYAIIYQVWSIFLLQKYLEINANEHKNAAYLFLSGRNDLVRSSSDTASSVSSVSVCISSMVSTRIVVSVRRRRPRCMPAATTASCCSRTPVSGPIPRAGTATLRRVDGGAGAVSARFGRGLPAVARPWPVSRHLGVGERHAAVRGRRPRLEVETLLEQASSLLQLWTRARNTSTRWARKL